MNKSPQEASSLPVVIQPDGALARFSLALSLVFWALCYAAALRHAMWRDEWQPLVAARDTESYSAFLKGLQWLGMEGFCSFCWLIQQAGLGIWFFKGVLVSIAALGIWEFTRRAPFSIPQKILFAFGYFPLYEYGTILRNYGIILTTSIFATSIIASQAMNPLVFGVCLAAMPHTNAFGVVMCPAFGLAYLYELYRRGQLTAPFFRRPATVAGLAIAIVGYLLAAIPTAITAFAAPEWAKAAGTGGSARIDSHFNRFMDSLFFPARGFLPIPLFGTWNSHFLDPWPWAQLLVGAVMLAAALIIISRNRTAMVLFGFGLMGLWTLFSVSPWTAMRYHGHFFVLLILALWLAERPGQTSRADDTVAGAVGWLRRQSMPLLTALLVVHAVVGATFTLQEQLVPFSGSREAANIICENEPADVLVIGDIDAWMTSLSGCLGRPIYIASRREFGSFVKIDPIRRWAPLEPDELAAVIQERLAAEQRDVVLVTNYPVSMPADFGMPLGVVDRSITDERYFIFRIRYRRPTN